MKRQLVIGILALGMMIGGAFLVHSADAHRYGGRGPGGDGRMHGMMMHDGYPMWRHLKELGLNDKQKAEVKEIRNRVMKETIQKKADKRIAGIELRDLLANDTVDMNAIQTKLKQMEALRTDIHLSHIKAREEIKSILTPEQRKKFTELCEMGPRMGGRWMKEGMGYGARRMQSWEEEESMQ